MFRQLFNPMAMLLTLPSFDATPFLDLPRHSHAPTRSKRTVAQDKRAAKKRKAVKRARRLGHA